MKRITYLPPNPERIDHFEPQLFVEDKIKVSRTRAAGFTSGALRVNNGAERPLNGGAFEVLWTLATHAGIIVPPRYSRPSLILAPPEAQFCARCLKKDYAKQVGVIREVIKKEDSELGNAVWGAIRNASRLGYFAASSLEAPDPLTILSPEPRGT